MTFMWASAIKGIGGAGRLVIVGVVHGLTIAGWPSSLCHWRRVV
jgi:hypothetical protein